MAKLSAGEIRWAAQKAGFGNASSVTATAIALAESGGDPNATNTTGNSAGTDRGLWQINDHYHPWILDQDWQNPLVNARAAKRVYDEAKGSFQPWSVFKSGSYKKHVNTVSLTMPQAIPGNSKVDDVVDAVVPDAVQDAAQGTVDVLKWVTTPANILRMVYVAGGIAAVIAGLSYLGSQSKVATSVTGTVKGAAKTVATKGKA